MKMTLTNLISSEMVWNKEKIQVVTEDENGKLIRSRVDRIEELQYDYEVYTVDWFESGEGDYCNIGETIPIIIFHMSKEE